MVGQATAKVTTLPIRETSSISANQPKLSEQGEAGTLFRAKLFGKAPDITFDGRTVSEQDAGQGISDCKTVGLLAPIVAFFAHPKLSGGSWTVAGKASTPGAFGDYTGVTNTYGDDGIYIAQNWIPGLVSRNPKGCSLTYIQNMLISCDTESGPGICKYWTNQLILTITPISLEDHTGTASATRSGITSQ